MRKFNCIIIGVLFCFIFSSCENEDLETNRQDDLTETAGVKLLDLDNPLLSEIIGMRTKSATTDENTDLEHPWLLNIQNNSSQRVSFFIDTKDHFSDRKLVYVKNGEERLSYIIERAYVNSNVSSINKLSADSIADFSGILTIFTTEKVPMYSLYYKNNEVVGITDFTEEFNKRNKTSTKAQAAQDPDAEIIRAGLLDEVTIMGSSSTRTPQSNIWFIRNSGRYTGNSGLTSSGSSNNDSGEVQHGGDGNYTNSQQKKPEEYTNEERALSQLNYLKNRDQGELASILKKLLFAPNLTKRQQEPIYLAIQEAYFQLMGSSMLIISQAFAEAFKPVIELALFNIGGDIAFKLLSNIGKTATLSFKITNTSSVATSQTANFFKGSKYTEKVLIGMKNTNDIAHNFPKNVDVYATRYGKWSFKIGGDGTRYEWLEMKGYYGGKNGTFEFTKDASGKINHRYFNID